MYYDTTGYIIHILLRQKLGFRNVMLLTSGQSTRSQELGVDILGVYSYFYKGDHYRKTT